MLNIKKKQITLLSPFLKNQQITFLIFRKKALCMKVILAMKICHYECVTRDLGKKRWIFLSLNFNWVKLILFSWIKKMCQEWNKTQYTSHVTYSLISVLSRVAKLYNWRLKKGAERDSGCLSTINVWPANVTFQW